jgi:TolA-binding protein
MRLLITILLSLILLNACTPVRNHSGARKPKSMRESSQKTDTTAKAEVIKERFSDTTLIVLPTVTAEKRKGYSDDFSAAVKEFDDENYKQACPKFRSFAETFSPGDSLYYEAQFFYSECLIQENKIEQGKTILQKIENDDQLTDIVRERVLVRMGQIYCLEDKEEKAEEYFRTLRNDYPRSLYIPLADCSVVK